VLSLHDTGRHPLLFIDEIEISEIDKIPGEISQDKNRVHPMDGVKKDNQSSYQTEVPERDWNDTLLFPLGGDPLNKESHGEHRLADEPEDKPEVELEFRIFD
jgi:hypothetical protein